jgi:hypothetical protein
MPFRFDGPRLDHILSYIIQPQGVSTLAAVCRQWNITCWYPGAWVGVVVDTFGWKPSGTKASQHYTLWKFTQYITVRPWMFRSASFLMRSGYKPWRWAAPAIPTPQIPLFPSRIITNIAEARWRQHRGHWWLVGTPACLSNVNMRITTAKGDTVSSWLFIGLADTNDVREVASIFLDKEKDGIVQRGPLPLESVQLALYGCIIREDIVMFHQNACELSSTKCRVQLDYLSLGVKDDCLELHVGSVGPIRTSLREQVCNDDYYYPVIACQADKGVYSLPDICPCLSSKDL